MRRVELVAFLSLATGLLLGCAQSAGSRTNGDERRAVGEMPIPPITDPHSTNTSNGAVLSGHVRSTDGTPVERAFVAVYGGLATRWRVGETWTNAEGEYRFDPLPGGALIQDEATGRWDNFVGVTVEHPACASADGNSWWDIRVPPGETVEHDFRMQPAGAVRGRLTDAQGESLADTDLRICSPDSRVVRFIRYTRTSDRGEFTEKGLAPGDYVIEINEHPYEIVGAARITAGETTTVELRRSAPATSDQSIR